MFLHRHTAHSSPCSVCIPSVFFSTMPRPPRSTPFPYTTLFRSRRRGICGLFGRPHSLRCVNLFTQRASLPHSPLLQRRDRKSTRLNSSHRCISYAVFCLKKKKKTEDLKRSRVRRRE